VLGLAAGREPLLAFIGALVGFVGILTVGQPDLATLLVVALTWSNTGVVLTRFHDAPGIVAAAIPAVLVVPFAYNLLVRREGVVITPAVPWIAGYFLVQLVSTMVARDPNSAMNGLTTFVTEGLILYLLITNAVRSPGILRGCVWALLLVAAFLGAISLVQQATHAFSNNFFGFAQTDASITGTTAVGIERLAGPIGEKNRYAQIMLMLVPLGVLAAIIERRPVLKVAAILAAALAVIAVTLTFSRGAALAGLAVLVVMAILRYVRIGQLIFAAVVVLAVVTAVPEYGARVSSLGALVDILTTDEGIVGSNADNSIVSRSTENLAALNVFLDHPIVGVGPGEFSDFYREYANDIGLSVRAEDREAHDLYLGIAAEGGILGEIAFLGAVAVTVRQLVRARRAAMPRRPDLAGISAAFLLAIVAYLASGLFLHLSFARYFWLMLGLASAAATVTLQAVADSQGRLAETDTAVADAARPDAPRPLLRPQITGQG
jgi:putative inorganic carbon (HCO3(-)) transporter